MQKYYVFLFTKSLIYSIPNIWFLLARQQRIPPIYDNNRYVTDFKEKCQILNSYFSEQYTLLKNISTLSKITFSRSTSKRNHPGLMFNNKT